MATRPYEVGYVPDIIDDSIIDTLREETCNLFTPSAILVHGIIIEAQPISVAQIVLYLHQAETLKDAKMIQHLSRALYAHFYEPA